MSHLDYDWNPLHFCVSARSHQWQCESVANLLSFECVQTFSNVAGGRCLGPQLELALLHPPHNHRLFFCFKPGAGSPLRVGSHVGCGNVWCFFWNAGFTLILCTTFPTYTKKKKKTEAAVMLCPRLWYRVWNLTTHLAKHHWHNYNNNINLTCHVKFQLCSSFHSFQISNADIYGSGYGTTCTTTGKLFSFSAHFSRRCQVQAFRSTIRCQCPLKVISSAGRG